MDLGLPGGARPVGPTFSATLKQGGGRSTGDCCGHAVTLLLCWGKNSLINKSRSIQIWSKCPSQEENNKPEECLEPVVPQSPHQLMQDTGRQISAVTRGGKGPPRTSIFFVLIRCHCICPVIPLTNSEQQTMNAA